MANWCTAQLLRTATLLEAIPAREQQTGERTCIGSTPDKLYPGQAMTASRLEKLSSSGNAPVILQSITETPRRVNGMKISSNHCWRCESAMRDLQAVDMPISILRLPFDIKINRPKLFFIQVDLPSKHCRIYDLLERLSAELDYLNGSREALRPEEQRRCFQPNLPFVTKCVGRFNPSELP